MVLTSIALMAQTPSPPPAPPLAPSPPPGVPSLQLQINQSSPLRHNLDLASPLPSTIPMLSSAPLEYHPTEEKPISIALMAPIPLPPPAAPPPTSPPPGVPSLKNYRFSVVREMRKSGGFFYWLKTWRASCSLKILT